MFTMAALESIIVSIVVSICVSTVVGVLVYCIVKKKYDEKIDRLTNRLWLFEERFFEMEKFVLHKRKYHWGIRYE